MDYFDCTYFDPNLNLTDTHYQNAKNNGNGRSSMENRVNSLKGSFSLTSSPNHGTQILIYLPLNEISLGFNNKIT